MTFLSRQKISNTHFLKSTTYLLSFGLLFSNVKWAIKNLKLQQLEIYSYIYKLCHIFYKYWGSQVSWEDWSTTFFLTWLKGPWIKLLCPQQLFQFSKSRVLPNSSDKGVAEIGEIMCMSAWKGCYCIDLSINVIMCRKEWQFVCVKGKGKGGRGEILNIT